MDKYLFLKNAEIRLSSVATCCLFLFSPSRTSSAFTTKHSFQRLLKSFSATKVMIPFPTSYPNMEVVVLYLVNYFIHNMFFKLSTEGPHGIVSPCYVPEIGFHSKEY